MKFQQTRLAGAFIIEPDRIEDERGFFARTICEQEFQEHGLTYRYVQSSISFNRKNGTLRGMHWQAEPHGEDKLVRCTMGRLFDVIVDLRPKSTTFHQWTSIELSAKNRKSVYIPRDFAHGFITLVDHTEVCYQISEPYHPELARGARWDDPAFGIEWPKNPVKISDKDRSYLDLEITGKTRRGMR